MRRLPHCSTRERAGAALQAVQSAYAMEAMPLVDYQVARFGRYDPAVLVQARKRIAAAAEAHALEKAQDISHFGGWRAYVQSKQTHSPQSV